jgi:hypothetical protein
VPHDRLAQRSPVAQKLAVHRVESRHVHLGIKMEPHEIRCLPAHARDDIRLFGELA